MKWHRLWHMVYELPLIPDDVTFLRDLLRGGEPEIQKSVLFEYYCKWLAAEESEPVEHRKENVGRRAANIWIREEIEDLRHKEPETVRKYREAVKTPPPKCCHTCHHYLDDGVCEKFQMRPPEDFAATPGKCPDYEQEVPF